MATNTFSTLRESLLRPRPAATYTWPKVTIPGTVRGDREYPWTHGTLAMTGWIRDASAVPQARVVQLIEYSTGTVIARKVSDAANAGNNYFFNGLAALPTGYRYVLVVYNEDGSTAARIKDNRTPV